MTVPSASSPSSPSPSHPPRLNQPSGVIEGAISRIESLQALDGPSRSLANLVSKILPNGPAKDAASGTWLGHPLHPMLVSVPIGAWTAAGVLDLTPGKTNSKAARRLIGLGVLAALPTALSGASDYSDTLGAERRVGLVHAAGAWTSIGLYAASWRARGSGKHGGTLLGLLAGGVLAATGYLGGHLSYEYGVGVNTTAFEGGPQEWTRVAAGDEVGENALVQVRADGVAICLTRRSGRVYALADRCSHRGGPLSEGDIDGDCVVCPWHGSAFRIDDGSVERGPASMPQPSYDVQEVAGEISVRRSEQRALRTNPA